MLRRDDQTNVVYSKPRVTGFNKVMSLSNHIINRVKWPVISGLLSEVRCGCSGRGKCFVSSTKLDVILTLNMITDCCLPTPFSSEFMNPARELVSI